MNERQAGINQLYAAYVDAGDDDMNARLRIKKEVAEIFERPVREGNVETVDVNKYLEHGHPVTDEELDVAEAEYGRRA